MAICPYNAAHHIPKEEERSHLIECRDRRIVEMQRYNEPLPGHHGNLSNPPFYGSALLPRQFRENPDEDFNISDFCDLVQKTVLNHQHVIIVGGTHYYISALLQPLAPLPERDMEIRRKIGTLDNPYQYLCEIDPITSQRLHPNDLVRIERAIEVYMISGQPLSVLLKQTPTKPLINAKMMILENSNLRLRIRNRIGIMMAQGYLQEAEMIFQNYSGKEKPFKSFSYFPLLQYLNNQISLEDALWDIEKGTWRLARKQRTWIKSIAKNINNTDLCIYDNKEHLKEQALQYFQGTT